MTTIVSMAALGALAVGTLTLFAGAPSASVGVHRSHATQHAASVAAAAPQTVAVPPTGAVPAAPVATPVAAATPSVPVVTPVAAAPVVTPVAAAPVVPSVSTLVGEVEASGIEPGSNWTWTMGDTATYCGPISGSGTGCTYGAAGLEHTTFAGTPTLALVAHELANAETQNDAVPSLLNEVSAAAAGTSWSPTDAVASCLVVHFMGFQDNAAGTWQCPAALATTVAEHIHDTY